MKHFACYIRSYCSDRMVHTQWLSLFFLTAHHQPHNINCSWKIARHLQKEIVFLFFENCCQQRKFSSINECSSQRIHFQMKRKCYIRFLKKNFFTLIRSIPFLPRIWTFADISTNKPRHFCFWRNSIHFAIIISIQSYTNKAIAFA